MTINELCKKAHENAVKHGWWDSERSFAEQIALMHSELSEALEVAREGIEETEIYYSCKHKECEEYKDGYCCMPYGCEKGKPEGIPIELADCVIRIFDTCGKYGIDLEKAINLKMQYNKTRPYKHGKAF